MPRINTVSLSGHRYVDRVLIYYFIYYSVLEIRIVVWDGSKHVRVQLNLNCNFAFLVQTRYGTTI